MKGSEWYKHIKEFRDSLAHRTPLYVPPDVKINDSEPKFMPIFVAHYDDVNDYDMPLPMFFHKSILDDLDQIMTFTEKVFSYIQ